jgi:hypothetical protein
LGNSYWSRQERGEDWFGESLRVVGTGFWLEVGNGQLVWGQAGRTTPAGGEGHRVRELGQVASCGGSGEKRWRTELDLSRRKPLDDHHRARHSWDRAKAVWFPWRWMLVVGFAAEPLRGLAAKWQESGPTKKVVVQLSSVSVMFTLRSWSLNLHLLANHFPDTLRYHARVQIWGSLVNFIELPSPLACVLLTLCLFCGIPTFAQSGLPTGVGWTALPATTSLLNSGACPPDYFHGDSYYFNYTCQNVIRAWSGAVADTTRNRLILWGGGGSSYYGNEVFALNLMANPVTLTRLLDPTVPSNFSNRSQCIESIPPGNGTAPNSRDTFGGLAYIASTDLMFSVGGSLACSLGSGTSNTWLLPFSSLSWQHMDPTLIGTPPGTNGGRQFGMIGDYDPNTGLVFVSDGNALYTYQYSTNTYARITPSFGFWTSGSMYGAIDPVRRLFVAVGNCPNGSCYANTGVVVADISNPSSTQGQNWTAATMADPSCAEFLSGGANPLAYGDHAPGLTFDAVGNTFVGWPNEGNSVYVITPDKVNQRLTCQKVTYSGGPPNSAQQNIANSTNGTFGRLRYFPSVDAFIVVNDYNIPAYVLRLRSWNQQLSFTPSSLTFPNQVVNTSSAPMNVIVTNTGSTTVTFSSIVTNDDYSQSNNCGNSLPSLGSCNVSVVFTPTGLGSRPGTLVFNDNSGTGQQTLTLQGTGIPPSYPVGVVSPTSLNFGNQGIGQSSPPQTVMLSNQGGAPLNISSITITPPYSQGNNCPASLSPQQSCNIAVVFTPTQSGPASGTLTVHDNDPSGPQTVSLTGTGVVVTLVSITLAPVNPTTVVGTPVQFQATGNYSDGSHQNLTAVATWSSSNTTVSTVSLGLAQALSAGTATITATYNGVFGSTVLTVDTNSLPTGVGWHALPQSTALSSSGACPPDYFGGDPYYFNFTCMEVIWAWNGAIADQARNRMLIFGGGHNNYYGNEIFSLNLTTNPVTMTRVKDPTVPTNFATKSTCIGGIPPGQPDYAPNSRETYGGIVYIPGSEIMYAFGGADACIYGTSALDTWTIPLPGLSSSTMWQHMDPTLHIIGSHPGQMGGNPGLADIADYDPNSGLVFLADTDALYTYNYSSNTYTQITPHFGFWTSEALYGIVDPVRKLFVVMGNCPGGTCSITNGVLVADISNPNSTSEQNWTAGTMADPNCAEFLSGGANRIPYSEQYPAITYDTVASTFVGWPNEGNSVYVMTPDTVHQRFTCRKLTFAGGPPNAHHQSGAPNTTNGTFGRFRYFPTFDVFVLVNDNNQPAYILRLR